jgi:hypothetical protein
MAFILIIDQGRAVSKTAMGKVRNGEERLKSAAVLSGMNR